MDVGRLAGTEEMMSTSVLAIGTLPAYGLDFSMPWFGLMVGVAVVVALAGLTLGSLRKHFGGHEPTPNRA